MGPFGSSIKVSTFVDHGVPVISGQHVKGVRLADGDYNFVTEEHADQLRNSNVRRGDVVLTHAGSIGQVAYIPQDSRYERYVLSQRQFYVRCGQSRMDPRFLTYYLKGPVGRHQLLANASQTGVPSIAQPVSYVRGLEVPVPPVAEQRAIVEVLEAVEDKIESNRLRADVSHCLAELTVGHALETAFEPRRLGDLAEFHNRRRVPLSAKQRAEMPGSVPYYGATGIFGYVDRAIFDEHLVLVGEDGSVVNDNGTPVAQYVWGPCWVNNHAHVLTGVGISTELLYLLVRVADVRPFITGAVQPKLNMGNLKGLPLLLPSANHLPALEEEVGPLLSIVRSAADENLILTELREALLPELLSGRLRVPLAEELAKAAT